MFETALRRFSLFPHFAQMGNDEPRPSGTNRKAHYLGNKEPVDLNQNSGGQRSGQNPKKKDARGYRDLATISIGEVNEAYQYFKQQLIPSPYPAWIAPDHFCMIHLTRKQEPRPSAVFGRVKTCYPGDGYIQNIQELELLLPHKDHAPDVIHLNADDILVTPSKPLQSYCVYVRFLAHSEDIKDFDGQEMTFFEPGYLVDFQKGFVDLLDINEHNHNSLPWLYVISSRWFASISDSMQPEIREKLTKLIHWHKSLFNYHPEHLPHEIHKLNRELGFKVGFTKVHLIEPGNPAETLDIVSRTFDKIFNQPMNRPLA